MIRQKFERAEMILKGVRVTDRLSEVDKRMLSNCKVVFNTIVGCSLFPDDKTQAYYQSHVDEHKYSRSAEVHRTLMECGFAPDSVKTNVVIDNLYCVDMRVEDNLVVQFVSPGDYVKDGHHMLQVST
jgi:hypothetical protein